MALVAIAVRVLIEVRSHTPGRCRPARRSRRRTSDLLGRSRSWRRPRNPVSKAGRRYGVGRWEAVSERAKRTRLSPGSLSLPSSKWEKPAPVAAMTTTAGGTTGRPAPRGRGATRIRTRGATGQPGHAPDTHRPRRVSHATQANTRAERSAVTQHPAVLGEQRAAPSHSRRLASSYPRCSSGKSSSRQLDADQTESGGSRDRTRAPMVGANAEVAFEGTARLLHEDRAGHG